MKASRKLSGPKPHWQSHPEDQNPDSEGVGDVTQRQKIKVERQVTWVRDTMDVEKAYLQGRLSDPDPY